MRPFGLVVSRSADAALGIIREVSGPNNCVGFATHISRSKTPTSGLWKSGYQVSCGDSPTSNTVPNSPR
ncbi:MAG TPA: hypothetical protein VN108_08885, partial [Marmoricola sp.]|nr:hypothetical protein [Marmoricola sp.]